MSETNNIEFNAIRLRLLDLIKSFFIDEPEQKKVNTWKERASSLTDEKITPGMNSALQKLDGILSTLQVEDLKEEYNELFTDPFSEHLIHTTLSYYADGHDFGQSLVDLRHFLLSGEITELEEMNESEDSLVFLLDILTKLIHDEENDPDNARKKQSELLANFIEPFSAFFKAALIQNEKAKFYEACAAFLSSYVDLEKRLFVDI